MQDRIFRLNNKLIPLLSYAELGLADGKMGYCIYFHILGKHMGNSDYTKIANRLLNDIYNEISNTSNIDVKYGLAGIGVGIRYLINEGYVLGNINSILKDIDDVVFKRLSYSDYCNSIDSLSLIHIIFYLCLRFKDQKARSESEYLFRHLIIHAFNLLYKKIDVSFFEEPPIYNIDYKFPLFLFMLTELYKLKIYNSRILNILPEISYKVESTYPVLNAHKLFLLCGLYSLNKVLNSKFGVKHMDLLKRNLDYDSIFENELMDKNIYIQNGVSSIYFIMIALKKELPLEDFDKIKNRILFKIEFSSIWDLLETDDVYFESYKGLINGFCIVPILYLIEKNSL